MSSNSRMPPITRSQADGNPSGKKSSADKRRQVKKGGGRGGRDDDSVDSKGNLRGLIDYEFDDSEEEQKQTKRKLFKKSKTGDGDGSGDVSNNKSKSKVDSKTAGKVAKDSSSDDDKPNFGRYSKNEVVTPIKKPSTSATAPGAPKKSLGGLSRLKKLAELKKRRKEEEEEEEETEDEYTEDSEDEDADDDDSEDDEYTEDEDDEEDDDEDDDEEGENGKSASIFFTFGADDASSRMIPQRHNLKKESTDVKKFVKLLTQPMEDNTIDTQIDQFKALTEEKKKDLLEALERRPTSTDTGVNLMLRILQLKLPQEVQAMVLAKYNALQALDPSSGEYYKMRNWLDKAVSVPFGLYKEMPVKIDDGTEKCGVFMDGARKCLNEAVYGQDDSKLQILQFISTKIANPSGRGLSLLLVGPPGIGKTSLIKGGIAKALGWPFQLISLGGDSDASTYSGHQLVYEGSHAGKIVNSLVNAKSMSCVMLFDELDKISATPKGEEVQNLLVHLTDPVQNSDFEDKYLAGLPIDLSKVMFVFSANDITKIDKILLDRLTVVNLDGYDLKQKITIAEQYLLPSALREVNLAEKVGISRDILQYIIEHYARDEKGVRELKRCIDQIVQKVNMLRMFNTKDLPFHIKDFTLPFVVKKEHIDLFIKRKEDPNAAPMGMYT